MADEGELKVEESGGGKKKLIIIIAIVVVVLIAGGVAAYFLLGGNDEPAKPSEAQSSTQAAPEQPKAPAFYVGMPRPFVFNVNGADRDRLVQIKVQLMVRGEDNEKLAQKNIPLIEGTLLNVFSAATVQQLSTPGGKDKLRNEALDATRKAMQGLTNKPVIEKVLFTGFVMQ
ncbi:flagellar basal body-associated protein FliL [Celerinatantimonas diazotrophica]|uniref:Flagellar protein FliL n=1 Tax=Celerinatantimonas diazotrophica TaxID=412034 RepID=A0A4R1JNN4_9GAMM|nr:flagellar basal body-associated protein FliL [Celerinatantimonas diazotrophica]TCK52129.1 flagellar FliL protein [Celerinatantimonas diazotrophica]CAG9296166.1 hypothetical protein CEDIAZO_01309 [Celerinatantimonas diazotrophica]